MNLSNLFTQKEQRNIGTALDISMLILIAFASCVLIWGETEFEYFLIALMFGFLGYFVKFRLSVYFSPRRGYSIHELKPFWKTENKGNESMFLAEYNKRSLDKSEREKDSANNSFLSYMNRSKLVKPNVSSVYESKKKISGFDFLTNVDSKKKLLRESFGPRGLNDSYIKNVSINEETRDGKEEQTKRIMNECMTKYASTLNKIQKENSTDFCDKIRKNLSKMKTKCLKFSQQLYTAYLENLKSLVTLLEDTYLIKISCRDFSDLERALEGTLKKLDSSLELNIIEIIDKVLKSKQLSFPLRRVRNWHVLNSLETPDSFTSKNNIDATLPFIEKLKGLREELLKLNSYFYNQETMFLTAEQILHNLKLMKEYEEEAMGENYEVFSGFNISEELSERQLIIFSISRNKLNEIVDEAALTLQFHRGTFMGWIRTIFIILGNAEKDFEVYETINSDLGHPHFDVKINQAPKEILHCLYGPENGYSCLLMYLWALTKRSPEAVRRNVKLSELIYEILGVVIL